MKKEYKINWFTDKNDYEKILSNDEVINIIGSKGSGKTTLSLKYFNNPDYVVINCDRLLELSGDKEHEELSKIRDVLKHKYRVIEENEKFLKQYLDIIDYVRSKKKKAVIEGNILQEISPITNLKGKVIVKRTSKIKSFIRAVKRDYKNEYFMKEEIKKYGVFGKVTRFFKVIKRRKKIFKQIKKVENIIEELEK